MKQLRVHQAAKNVLIFVPLVLAQRFFDWGDDLRAILLFVAFSLVSCGSYVINDLLDIEKDRHHPTKRNRPLASGVISVRSAMVVCAVLLVAGLALSATLGWPSVAMLLAYLALTLLYSFVFKRLVVADVIVLAALYTLRIFAGAVAIEVPMSIWVTLTSVFMFFSLALMKRYSEFAKYDGEVSKGRGYLLRDRHALLSLGVASSIATVLVVGLYIDSDAVRVLYGFPQLLWAAVPLLLYWVTRLWILTERGEMHDDPVAFAITDRVSQVVFVLVAIVVIAAALIGRT